jgi:hypothetical protein
MDVAVTAVVHRNQLKLSRLEVKDVAHDGLELLWVLPTQCHCTSIYGGVVKARQLLQAGPARCTSGDSNGQADPGSQQ